MDSKLRSYKFALMIIEFIDKLGKDTTSITIAKQLLRSATSIGANIAEAHASPSRKDFTNFFYHALKSANETKYWLELLHDANKADKEKVNFLLKEADIVAKILGASILTLKGRKNF